MSTCTFQDTGGNHVLGCEYFYNKDTVEDGEIHASYNLGNGKQEQNREKASRQFLEREFPSIIDGQNEAIFVPNCFIAQRPEFIDIDLSILDENQASEIKKNKAHLRGDTADGPGKEFCGVPWMEE